MADRAVFGPRLGENTLAEAYFRPTVLYDQSNDRRGAGLGDRSRVAMHILVFFLINLVVAIAMGVMAYVNGHGAGSIAWRVIGTLIVLQAAYAIWVGVVAWLGSKRKDDTVKQDAEAATARGKLPPQPQGQPRGPAR